MNPDDEILESANIDPLTLADIRRSISECGCGCWMSKRLHLCPFHEGYDLGVEHLRRALVEHLRRTLEEAE